MRQCVAIVVNKHTLRGLSVMANLMVVIEAISIAVVVCGMAGVDSVGIVIVLG